MDNKDDNIYIFPSGRYGEFFARILIKNEVNVKGFLDNDLCKHDTSIMGLNCFFPDYLKSSNNTSNSQFIIATIYDSLKPLLKRQLINMGVLEEQIVVD